jgi:CRP-like cAMP-binding protein
MDHGIQTITRAQLATIDAAAIVNLAQSRPALGRALAWATLVDEATMRQWIVGMGRLSSECRLGHLICEVFTRLDAVGMADDGTFDFPITQAALADTLGISDVHTNRVVQHLREQGYITWKRGKMTVHDIATLADFAAFNPNYLHLVKRRSS